MEIRLSKYNLPFSEPFCPNVHYIALDFQRDMASGKYQSHVDHYFSLSSYSHLNPFCYAPRVDEQEIPLTADEIDFLQELSHSGIKAANKTLADYWDGANE